MWSAAACRRLCDLARYCGCNEARQALQEKAVAQLPHSIFISAHCSVIEHGAMVFLFWRHSNNRWRSEDRRYEPSSDTTPLALLHPHSGFSRDHRNRVLLRILRLHLQDLDLRFSVAHGSHD